MTHSKCQIVFSGTFLKGTTTVHAFEKQLSIVQWDSYTHFLCCSVEGSGWSSEGLRTESVTREGNNVTVTCSSNHLTSFSVLVDVSGAKVKKCVHQMFFFRIILQSELCLLTTAAKTIKTHF